MYKYVIYTKDGHRYEHCDPYGFGMELRPAFASYITDSDEYRFTDERWLKNRTKNFNSPMNIYELHLGSWKLIITNGITTASLQIFLSPM